MWCGARDTCGRHAEVVVHVGSVAVFACMSDGVRMARNIDDHGDPDLAVRVVLIDDRRRQLTIGPRGA